MVQEAAGHALRQFPHPPEQGVRLSRLQKTGSIPKMTPGVSIKFEAGLTRDKGECKSGLRHEQWRRRGCSPASRVPVPAMRSVPRPLPGSGVTETRTCRELWSVLQGALSPRRRNESAASCPRRPRWWATLGGMRDELYRRSPGSDGEVYPHTGRPQAGSANM